MTAPPLVLASASPRRRDLLGAAGFVFRVDAPHVDETVAPGTSPHEAVAALAARKAAAVAARHVDAVVLAADTLLDLDGEVLGKPADVDAACALLARLAGRRHDVLTAVAVWLPGEVAPQVEVVRTSVTFRPLSAEEIAAYVATGEPLDKAGAYAIQGGAADFVARLEGPYDNVVGLPMATVRRMLSS